MFRQELFPGLSVVLVGEMLAGLAGSGMVPGMGKIHETLEDHVLELNLDFNEKNIFDNEALDLFGDTFRRHATNHEAKVVILSSSAGKFFSNGLSPELFVDRTEREVYKAWKLILDITNQLVYFPRPVIMMIQGHCMALSAVHAIACDYRFMALKSGRIGFPESSIAMTFPVLSLMLLKELVGSQKCRDILYGGLSLKPDEAKAIGLIDEYYEPDEIREKTWKFARKLAKTPLSALEGIKRASREAYRYVDPQLLEWDLNQLTQTILTPNCQEGFKSLQEGRRPVFAAP